jgi:Na+/H+ antiporter NhaD/arsenite permease-like protein
MSRIPFINDALSFLLSKNTMIVSALSCQFISNVPSAILLSNFTDNYSELLLGVNIGGAGTLIASLASLITFREYTTLYPGNTLRYLIKFSVFNFVFLFGLLLLQSIFNILVV